MQTRFNLTTQPKIASSQILVMSETLQFGGAFL